MTKRALIIIDLINDYLDHWSAGEAARLISETNKLVAAFREAELPIIWVRQEFLPDLSDAFLEMRDKNVKIAIEGTSGAQLHADLGWQPADITIVKKRYSAFYKTELEDILSAMRVGELVLCGINTHACIRMAAIDAYQRDFRVTLAAECIDSYDAEHARVSLGYMNGKIAKVITVPEIIQALSPVGTDSDMATLLSADSP
ncbi:cysteine hydrolase [Mesorhizobium sp. M7A.F.Ca.US.001.04.2.1]|uniref:cysteine hydrolase family protein n=2 Tax=unclassified Mesorhizobium TaxID=325217 RepID=UPI000FCBAF87|nr:isochorismatase family cysteine hydrolase [Mesorhizobium sp. M7A.F.Ca.US.001.04.2.1]RUY20274.1 cysteine hydrolase [Mesorhizobium sp. M7A.F.Ca.US.001.04.2.1]